MSVHRAIYPIITVTALVCLPALALAQTAPSAPPHVPLQKAIGQVGSGPVPSLLVMNGSGAKLAGGKLTLTGVTQNSIMFADRPVRAAGHVVTSHLLREWSPTNPNPDSFAKVPPNATVSAFSKDGATIRDAVVVLKTAKLEGDQLTFDVDVLEGDLTGADGAAALFIDRFGGFGGFHAGGFHAGGFGGFHAGGFHAGGFDRYGAVGVGRVGYAGAWHRPVYGGAWYAGGAAVGAAAAVGTAAAVGAAAAAPYYGYYGAPACGYYPYPPCY
jgi:hypothetical protein